MSYSHMMSGSNRPQYEIMSTNYNPQHYPMTSHSNYLPPISLHTSQQQQNTSIALFHIPSDATNSLYVDGVPNDTS